MTQQLLFAAVAISLLNSCTTTPTDPFDNKKDVTVVSSHVSTVKTPAQQTHLTNAVYINPDVVDKELSRPDTDSSKAVTTFARSLAQAGRHQESAAVYKDAADRFTSIGGLFEQDCLKEATRQYWLAGNKAEAQATLRQIELKQDIYSRGAETAAFKSLKTLINN